MGLSRKQKKKKDRRKEIKKRQNVARNSRGKTGDALIEPRAIEYYDNLLRCTQYSTAREQLDEAIDRFNIQHGKWVLANVKYPVAEDGIISGYDAPRQSLYTLSDDGKLCVAAVDSFGVVSVRVIDRNTGAFKTALLASTSLLYKINLPLLSDSIEWAISGGMCRSLVCDARSDDKVRAYLKTLGAAVATKVLPKKIGDDGKPLYKKLIGFDFSVDKAIKFVFEIDGGLELLPWSFVGSIVIDLHVLLSFNLDAEGVEEYALADESMKKIEKLFIDSIGTAKIVKYNITSIDIVRFRQNKSSITSIAEVLQMSREKVKKIDEEFRAFHAIGNKTFSNTLLYFIWDGRDTKIGVSKRVIGRYLEITTGNPHAVLLGFVIGGFRRETMLHEKFGKLRVPKYYNGKSSEWFKITPDMVLEEVPDLKLACDLGDVRRKLPW